MPLKISSTGNVEHFSGDQHKPPRCKQGLVVHFGQTVRADIYLAWGTFCLGLKIKAFPEHKVFGNPVI